MASPTRPATTKDTLHADLKQQKEAQALKNIREEGAVLDMSNIRFQSDRSPEGSGEGRSVFLIMGGALFLAVVLIAIRALGPLEARDNIEGVAEQAMAVRDTVLARLDRRLPLEAPEQLQALLTQAAREANSDGWIGNVNVLPLDARGSVRLTWSSIPRGDSCSWFARGLAARGARITAGTTPVRRGQKRADGCFENAATAPTIPVHLELWGPGVMAPPATALPRAGEAGERGWDTGTDF